MEHLYFGKGLKTLPHEGGIRETYLGQALIAGTGPEGKTCRECVFWGVQRKGGLIQPPGHYAASNKKMAGQLKKGRCHKLMHRKPNRLFTPHAKSCRLFEQAHDVPPLEKAPTDA